MTQEILHSLSLFVPELILVLTIVISIVLDLIPNGKKSVQYFSIISLIAILIYELITFGCKSESIFYNMLKIDIFSDLFKIFILFSTLSIILVSNYSKEVDREYKSEYYVLLLSMCLGMVLLVSQI